MSDIDRILHTGQGKVYPMAGIRLGAYGTKTTAATLNAAGPQADPRRQRLDATAGAFTLTMPANSSDGDLWLLEEVAGLATAITIDGNGKNINGAATLTFNQPYRVRWLQWDATLDGWIIVASNGV